MERRRFGYRRLTIMLRREGFIVNHKRVYRNYDAAGLQVRARKKRGVRHVRGNVIQPVTKPNERWSADFVSDTLSTGRRFRALTIVDDFSRECIAIEVDFSLTGARVATVLTRSAIARGACEFTCDKMLEWSALSRVSQHFIDPGKPTQNGSVEASTVDSATNSSRNMHSQRFSMRVVQSRNGDVITTRPDRILHSMA